jgi:hypothetical protein
MPALLAAEHKTPQRHKMIEYSIQEQAPHLYRDLKKSGQLKSYILEVDQNLIRSFEADEEELRTQMLRDHNPNQLERIQKYNVAVARAWEVARSTWLEFRD